MALPSDLKDRILNVFRSREAAQLIIDALEAAQTIEATELNVDDDVAMNDFKITGLADPEDPQDAATKAWVEANAGGFANPATEDLDMDGNDITNTANIVVADDATMQVGYLDEVGSDTTRLSISGLNHSITGTCGDDGQILLRNDGTTTLFKLNPMTGFELESDQSSTITVGADLDVLVTGGNDIWLTAQNGGSYTTFQVGDQYVEVSSGSNLITANGTTNKISMETTELLIIAPEAEVPNAQFYMHTVNEQAYLWFDGTFAEFGSDGTAETYITSGTGGILLNSDDRVDASASVGPLRLPNTSVHASPQNGDIWYDTGSNTIKARVNGATVTITTS